MTAVPETQYRFLAGQNEYMKRHGICIHSICSPGKYLLKIEQRDGAHVYPVSISRKISPILDFISLVRLVFLLRSIRPDILHVSTPKASLIGAVAGKLARVPSIIYYVRGSATENERGLKRMIYRCFEWLTAKLSDQTVCVSPSLLKFMRSEGIVRESEGTVAADGMSNGIDIDVFNPTRVYKQSCYCQQIIQWLDEDCEIIGFVGRLASDKGIGELEQSWQSLKKDYPNLRLLLVGEWDKIASVDRDVISRLKQDEHVCLPGVVADVVPWLKVIDVLAFPTHGTEGFPNAVAEAAAMEIPVVGSDVIGVVDAIVDGETGVIIPKNDSRALTDAIAGYLDDPMKRKADGARARLRVIEKFQRIRIWKSLLRIYQEALCDQGLGELAGQLDDGADDNKSQSQRAA